MCIIIVNICCNIILRIVYPFFIFLHYLGVLYCALKDHRKA